MAERNIEDLLVKYEPDSHTSKYLKLKNTLSSDDARLCQKLGIQNITSVQELIVAGLRQLDDELFAKIMEDHDISEIKLHLCKTPEGDVISYVLNNEREEYVIYGKTICDFFEYKVQLERMFSAILAHPSHYKDLEAHQIEKTKSVLSESRALDDASIESVLDLGCGLGYSTFPLAQMYPNKKIIAVDFSDEALAIEKKDLQNVRVKRGDIEYLDSEFVDQTFSAAICVNSLETTRPWEVFRGISKIINGPTILVYDGFSEKDMLRWASWYGLKSIDSFTVSAMESRSGENQVNTFVRI